MNSRRLRRGFESQCTVVHGVAVISLVLRVVSFWQTTQERLHHRHAGHAMGPLVALALSRSSRTSRVSAPPSPDGTRSCTPPCASAQFWYHLRFVTLLRRQFPVRQPNACTPEGPERAPWPQLPEWSLLGATAKGRGIGSGGIRTGNPRGDSGRDVFSESGNGSGSAAGAALPTPTAAAIAAASATA